MRRLTKRERSRPRLVALRDPGGRSRPVYADGETRREHTADPSLAAIECRLGARGRPYPSSGTCRASTSRSSARSGLRARASRT
jgi:hypothetical protein